MPNPPSRNPANDDGLLGALRIALQKHQQSVDGRLPVRVVSHDRATNRVSVEHQIQIRTTDGQFINRSRVASVPALVLGAGGFFINFDIQPGNLGWIQACDRDISLFLQGYQKSPPNDGRLHDFSSGVFIPDVMTGYTINADDDGAMVIQNTAGTVRLSLSDSRIKAVVGGVDVLTLTNTAATFGVPIIDSNGVNHNTHSHEQGNDSRGDTEADTDGPKNP